MTYLLRTCNPGGRSYDGFEWPLEVGAEVVAPDWDPAPRCGGGLHGLAHGEGDGSLLNWGPDAVWLVVEADDASVVDLGGKVKVPRATVVHVGDRASACEHIAQLCPGRAVVGGAATAGVAGTATAGDRGTATAGNEGTATAGDWGTATAGDWGTATAGVAGTATAGDWGTATAGDAGTATAGDWGTATAGDRGTATAGDWGTATAGDAGTATAGDRGTVTVRWWSAAARRYRVCVGEVGVDGIEAGVPYRVVDGHLTRADEEVGR